MRCATDTQEALGYWKPSTGQSHTRRLLSSTVLKLLSNTFLHISQIPVFLKTFSSTSATKWLPVRLHATQRSSSWASSTPNARLYTLKSEVSNRPCMMNVSAFAMAAMTQRTEKSHHDQAAMKCYNLNLLHVDIVPRSKPYLHHGMPMQSVTEAHGHRTFTFWNHWFPTCVDSWFITVSREETISSSVCRNLCHHLPIPCVYPTVSTSNFHLEDPSQPCALIVETTVCMQQTIDPGRWNGIKHEVFSDNFLIKHWTKSIDDM